MILLSKAQIILLHSQLIAETGGSDGIRDDGLLESAVNTPVQSFDGTDLFPTTLEKAARLGFGLIKNHAFVDGNKRIGAHAMLMTLALNQITISYTQTELVRIITDVASGGSSYILNEFMPLLLQKCLRSLFVALERQSGRGPFCLPVSVDICAVK